MAARHKDGYCWKKMPKYFLGCKGLSYPSMASGCRGTTYLRKYDRELVLKPEDSFKKRWGGYRRTTREPVWRSVAHLYSAMASPPLFVAMSVVKKTSSSVTVPPTRQGP